VGPFPSFRRRTRGGRFDQVLETPSETSTYFIRGALVESRARGSFRAVEGYDADQVPDLVPDPDGGLVCDTGLVTFEAARVGPVRG
jgi:hypothetical protein